MVTRRNTPKASRRKRTAKAARPRRSHARSPRKARGKAAARPSAGDARQLRADRERLGLGRGEDMTVAAADMELRADRQISRDAVHEREISGS